MLDPHKPRAWLFDFGGTLDAEGVPWLERFLKLYQKAGVPVERERLDAVFDVVEQRLLQENRANHVRQRTLQELVDKHTSLQLELLHIPYDRIGPFLASGFYEESKQSIDRARPLLNKLKKSNLPLAIVSNFYGNLREICESTGLLTYFDEVLDSAVTGYAKPDRRIFLEALRRLKIDPTEAVMVGDNHARDLVPAKELGMTTVWVAPRERPLPFSHRIDHRVSSVTELEHQV